MALPTKEQCKLKLSINMVAKTMTVSLNQAYLNPAINTGLESFALTNAVLTDPIGNIYTIDELTGTDSPYVYVGSQTFSCTLDSNGNVLNGNYAITVGTFDLTYQSNDTTYTNVDSSFTLSYVAPTAVISQSYNVVEPIFVSTDITDYRVTDPLTQGFVNPVPSSYSHSVHFPVNSSGFPNNTVTTSTFSIALGAYEFYYGTQTGTTTRSLSYTFSDGLVVIDTITGSIETMVNPATEICSVVCGLNKLYSVMEANKNLNRTQYLLNKAEYEFLLSKTANAQANITCGNAEQAQIQINDVKASLGDCCNDCVAYTDGDLVNGVGNPVFPFTPENVINKSQDIIADTGSSIKYPSVVAVEDYVTNFASPLELPVFYGLSAQGTTSSTTAILDYGVNVFSTVTASNFCAKLPQPVTGQRTRVVNLGTGTLVLYPSNVGGQINNYPINTPAQIPADGNTYEFLCVENPMPGAWTWSAPATAQYDSGVITTNTTLPYTNVILAVDANNVYEHESFFSSSSWAWDGKNRFLIQNFSLINGGVCAKPVTSWNGVTKIKVYTNCNVEATFGLMAGGSEMLYDPTDTSSNGIVTNGPGGSGNYGFAAPFNAGYYAETNQIISGASLPYGTITANIGDPGTSWGELVYTGGSAAGYSTFGDINNGIIPNPYVNDYPAFPNVWSYYTSYWEFGIQTRLALTGFKFQFFIEYF